MKKLYFLIILVQGLLLGWGCNASKPNPSVQRKEPIVAKVNDVPIRQKDLLKVLLPGYGRRILDELTTLEVIRQHAAGQGIKSAEGVKREELRRILHDMAPDKPAAKQIALLNYMLQSRGMSRAEFEVIVETNALLRCLADPNVAITEDSLHSEYERLYGPGAQVRLIAVMSFRRIEKIQAKLARGEDFVQLVREFSEDELSLARDGLLGPFCREDRQIPAEIRRMAFSLTKIGEQSEIFSYLDQDNLQRWCLLQLEKLVTPERPDFDVVRNELKENLRQREIEERMVRLRQELKKKARIRIYHPLLRPPISQPD